MMINKTYSILVAGYTEDALRIPETFSAFRDYVVLPRGVEYIPSVKDPYERALFANTCIKVAKKSVLFPYILQLDPSNTYDTDTPDHIPGIDAGTDSVIKFDHNIPVYSITYTAVSGIVNYTFNGYKEGIVTAQDNMISIVGAVIELSDTSEGGNIRIYSPYNIKFPDYPIIKRMMRYLPKEYQNMVDISNPADVAAVICLYALYRWGND